MGFEEYVSDGVTLVKFGADWCGPCQQMDPIIERIEEDYDVLELDVEEDQNIANQYQVRSLPTLLLFQNGEVVDQSVGFTPEEDIRFMLEENAQIS